VKSGKLQKEEPRTDIRKSSNKRGLEKGNNKKMKSRGGRNRGRKELIKE